VLLAQRDRNEARIVLIETKQEQLSAIVNAYQALGGGTLLSNSPREQPARLLQLSRQGGMSSSSDDAGQRAPRSTAA